MIFKKNVENMAKCNGIDEICKKVDLKEGKKRMKLQKSSRQFQKKHGASQLFETNDEICSSFLAWAGFYFAHVYICSLTRYHLLIFTNKLAIVSDRVRDSCSVANSVYR